MPAKKTVTRKRKSSIPTVMPELTAPRITPVVYTASCGQCEHMPMSVNMLVSVLVAVIFTLSAIVLSASISLNAQNSQLKAYNQGAVGSVTRR